MLSLDRARAGAITPGLVAFMLSPRLRRHPYLPYRMLRSLDPVHQSPFGLYVFSRHADVVASLRHPRLGSDEHKADMSVFNLGPFEKLFQKRGRARNDGPFAQTFDRLMLFRDAPDHTRLRRLASKAFTPPRAEQMAPRITELVVSTLDRVAPRGSMEVMRELAYPLPALVIGEMLGIPDEDIGRFVSHAPTLAVGLDPGPMRTAASVAAADRAVAELTDYLTTLIDKRRADPGDDLLSALIQAEEGGDSLDTDELIAMVLLLVVAGHETTANLIGNGLVALLDHPDELARWRSDPALDKTAIEELLRFDSPVQMSQRITLEEVELAGETIPAGRMIILCLGAANRDPEAFPDPDRLDLGRGSNHHLSFGGGSHFCLGAALARVEARIVLTHLIRRLPNLERAGKPVRRPSFTIRGLESLPLSW